MTNNYLTYNTNFDKPNYNNKSAVDLELDDFANPKDVVDPMIFETAFNTGINYNLNSFQSPLSCISPDNITSFDPYYQEAALFDMNQNNTNQLTAIKTEPNESPLAQFDGDNYMRSTISVSTPNIDPISPYSNANIYANVNSFQSPSVPTYDSSGLYHPLITSNIDSSRVSQFYSQDFLNQVSSFYPLTNYPQYTMEYANALRQAIALNQNAPVTLNQRTGKPIPDVLSANNNSVSKESPLSYNINSMYTSKANKKDTEENNSYVQSGHKSRAPDRPKSIPCTYPGCKKLFSRPYNMRAHLEIHSPIRIKPHTCTVCNRAFSRKHDLTRHVKTIHQRSGDH
ncbi:hypothetical protein K502DRAFT_325272 [Neoconidiobolus thromboides FSU 785]|nr:hypothetical protein K502DRAFT_325272 [Neoconidiobolus thromboides FSU 785]